MVQIIRIPCGIVNCYLVKQGNASFLVDTGYEWDASHLERALAANSVLPGDLYLILLTHGHTDHAGGAARFREKYSLPIAMAPQEDDLDRPYLGKGLINKSTWTLTRMSAKRRGSISPDVALRDGQSLQPFGLSAEVVQLPGHTAGSVGFLFPDGRLICGDTFTSVTRPRLSYIAEDTSSLRESVNRVAGRDVTLVYPGHGKPFIFRELYSKK